MNNLNNMFKNGSIPDEMKEKLSGFLNQNAAQNNHQNTNEPNNFNTNEETHTNQTQSSTQNPPNINPEMLQNLMKMFSQSNSSNSDSVHNSSDNNASSDGSSFGSNIDMNTIFKLKNVMDKMQNNKDDPRANLLLSLKPYLKESRKSKVEQYVQLFGMTKILETFNESGGEHTK